MALMSKLYSKLYRAVDPEGRKIVARFIPGKMGLRGRGVTLKEHRAILNELVKGNVFENKEARKILGDARGMYIPKVKEAAPLYKRLDVENDAVLLQRSDRGKFLPHEAGHVVYSRTVRAPTGSNISLRKHRKAEYQAISAALARLPPVERAATIKELRRNAARFDMPGGPLGTIARWSNADWHGDELEQIAQAYAHYSKRPRGFKRKYPNAARFIRSIFNNNSNIPKVPAGGTSVPLIQFGLI